MSQKETCLSCKIISIGCLFAIGAYFIKHGLNNKSKYVYNGIALASIGLGIGEIFDYSPLRNKTQNTK